MKSLYLLSIAAILVLASCRQSTLPTESLTIDGLTAPVEILVDEWGIPHIYAETEEDLFFAQGYYACMDRTFQFEVWRMQATGTTAKVMGEKELKRDIGTRLFKFRGDMDDEMNHYHENGKSIIESYIKGVNAYVDRVLADPSLLPSEFKLLGILPEHWTPEVVISRHQGLLGNIGAELTTGRLVATIGEQKTRDINYFHPNRPDLTLDRRLTKEVLDQDILGIYNAYRRPLLFEKDNLKLSANEIPLNNEVRETPIALSSNHLSFGEAGERPYNEYDHLDESIGSNNWIVNGKKMASGHALMANDPHRRIAVPSLRYMAHLVAPGWNVIGGGEPEIPGISIGHNGIGSWGLTVHRTDAEDLYFYETNPTNPNQYKVNGEWVDMEIINESIEVRGQEDYVAELKYTNHGPVVFEDKKRNLAFAVKCGWAEIGGAPYLASLRMDQAKTFDEFREACNYSHIPGENMVWADKDDNIGWQAVGIAPIRTTHSGMVPVPGDGTHEWAGYLEIKERPNLYNPDSGYFSTSNEDVTPPDFPHKNTHAYQWSDPYRGYRTKEVFEGSNNLTFEEMKSLQTDYKSMSSTILIPLLSQITFDDEETNSLIEELVQWDNMLDVDSKGGAIYAMWETKIVEEISEIMIPKEAKNYLNKIQLKRVIDIIQNPDQFQFPGAEKGINSSMKQSFIAAISDLKERLGDDPSTWTYGNENLKHIQMIHPLSNALLDDMKAKYEVGPAPRGGNAYTVGSTGGRWNQPSGASFKVIINTGDWDSSVAMNSPGQAGDPDDPHYRNLFDLWAKDGYFPLLYSRDKVEKATVERIQLSPR